MTKGEVVKNKFNWLTAFFACSRPGMSNGIWSTVSAPNHKSGTNS